MRIPPFDRVEARRALSKAIDRREVVRAAGGTLAARVTCQIVPPGWAGYREYCPYTIGANKAGAWLGPDLDEARALVRRFHTAGTKVTVWFHDWSCRSPVTSQAFYARSATAPHPGPFRQGRTMRRSPRPRRAPRSASATGAPTSPTTTRFSRRSSPATSRRIRTWRASATRASTASSAAPASTRRAVNRPQPAVTGAPSITASSTRHPGSPCTTHAGRSSSRRLGNFAYNPQNGFLIDQAWVR